MRHTSIPVLGKCEFINITPVNPLIARCQIKVCYVGDTPNRNGSIITKETAEKLANSLPGSPIVGAFNEASQDFEEHNRNIKIAGGKCIFEDATRPYGFVDLGAKVWFQTYLDDDSVEREYLCTEGWLWTQYPEVKHTLEHGNNQSMELDEDTIDATWSYDEYGCPEFYVINEAIVTKLCILGDDFEPCFEGSTITPIQFSFGDKFMQTMSQMMQDIKDLKEMMSKGGNQKVFNTYSVTVGDALWSALYSYLEETYPKTYRIDGVYEEEAQTFAVVQNINDNTYMKINFSFGETSEFSELEDITETYKPAENPQFNAEDIAAYAATVDSSDEEKENEEGEVSEEEEPSEKEEETTEEEESETVEEEKEEDEKVASYSLEEIPEYVSLTSEFSELKTKYEALVEENEKLNKELAPLVAFKQTIERKEKEAMIENFYMLSDEDKKDVIENIDTYSVDEIEAKLSVICVRNKVSFDMDEKKEQKGAINYNLNSIDIQDAEMPAWLKSAFDVAKTMK